MSRRTRTAALLSTATLLAGAAFSLALAPSASADIPTPPLGDLTVSNTSPTAGQTIQVSGTGCFALTVQRNTAVATASASAAPDAAAAAAPAASASASPTDSGDPTDPPADAGSVSITVTGPGSFQSTDTAQASENGSWGSDNGITLGDAGDYTVKATCTLTDSVLGQQATFDYDPLDLTVAAAPVDADPTVTCSGCSAAKAGDTISVGGTDFPKQTATATVALAGYASQTAQVDSSGGFAPVTFTLTSTQAAGSLAGTVTVPGTDPVSFTVTVVAPSDDGGNADGPVPGDNDGGNVGTGDTGTGDTDTTTSTGVDVSSAAPSLPNTGTDSLWPSVVGGLLVLSGGGLLWVSRRRNDAEATTAA